jgi:copper chaperone CopZ
MTSSSSSTSPRVYVVAGMTCEHCVMSVTEEVAELPGVDGVSVDLASGQLKVSGPVSDDAVKAAVAEAGYEVVS